MRLVALAAVLVMLPAVCVPCQDFAVFVRGTDRSDNTLVLELLRSPDLSTALAAARALGSREDPYVADILGRLLAGRPDRSGPQRELVLRAVLASAFAAGTPDLGRRLEVNREGLEPLASRLAEFAPALQREILRLLAEFPQAADPGALMGLGMSLSELARRQGGRLTAEQAALLVDYLEAVAALGDPDFAPVALMILEGTREASVARAARKTARVLLAAAL